jgi:hypothetical protein
MKTGFFIFIQQTVLFRQERGSHVFRAFSFRCLQLENGEAVLFCQTHNTQAHIHSQKRRLKLMVAVNKNRLSDIMFSGNFFDFIQV